MNQSSWFVRCYYEWMQSAQTFFYTLTYNNDNLPHRYGMPCFSKRDIQKFLDRLRKAIYPFGAHLKYFVSSEYGELYKRPHYHVLFFLDKQINPFQFYKLVERMWKYGFVKYGDNVGVVNSFSGIRYVTKYVSKDISYTNDFDSKFLRLIYSRCVALLTWLASRYPEHELDFNKIILFYNKDENKVFYRWLGSDMSDFYSNEELRDFCDKLVRKIHSRFNFSRPFHLQSTKLGSNILDLPCDVLERCEVPVTTSAGVQKFPLPRYFKRHLWYDVVENEVDHKKNRFVLNDVGKQHLLARLNDQINSNYENIQKVLLNIDKLDSSILPKLRETGIDFKTFTDFHYFLKHIDIDLYHVAIYRVVFRGRVCPFPFKDIRFSDSNFVDYYPFVEACLYETSMYDYGKIYRDEYTYNSLERHLFDYHPFIRSLDFISKIVDIIHQFIAGQRSDAFRKQEILARETRDLFNLKT